MARTWVDLSKYGRGGLNEQASVWLQDLETAARGYRIIRFCPCRAQASSLPSAATYGAQIGGTFAPLTTGSSNWFIFYLDETNYSATDYTTYARLTAGCVVTDTAPAITLTIGLYPITAVTGGTTVTALTLGTVVTGSTVAFASPAANSIAAPTSTSDFAFPAAGWYIFGVATSAGMPAGSNVTFSIRLEVRNA